ncbi:E3 ubiquitin protein ligase DRIP2 [Cocos nucifera]|uniref:E3 ubiquitin protein ligase DRIP2 n=1 Tax=Cocos nucifera TaxID=13894 RepID=A0A8K0N5L0_COCNU|nr:E3 ubiquitin protein ligase DRIP2 [Cocos nucifera]
MLGAAAEARSSPPPPPPPQPRFVKIKRDLLKARLTCPLCRKLLREATTISECLHTFCRKCIFDKLADEELDCCPTCNIDLGCTPVEKLRPDHNVQDMRAKIFPFRKEKVNTLEVPSVLLPVRIKERSLSSLVVNTPRVASQTGLTGRRTKASRRAAALSGPSPTRNESVRKEDDGGVQAKNSNSFETLSKTIKNRRQNDSDAVPSVHASNKDKQNDKESYLDKTELWEPLDCLFEAAKRTKALYSSRQSPVVKADQVNGPDSEVPNSRTNLREHPHKSKVQDDKNGIPVSPLLAKARRLHGVSRRRRELGTSAQAKLDAVGCKHERKIQQFWFSLVAAADQEGSAPLHQLRARYLRIKDGSLPVSFVQKYLAKKLDIANEYEVEVMCRGQAVSPIMTLQNLVDMWFQTGSSHKIQTLTGSSGKDLVMVLVYRHKAPAS